MSFCTPLASPACRAGGSVTGKGWKSSPGARAAPGPGGNRAPLCPVAAWGEWWLLPLGFGLWEMIWVAAGAAAFPARSLVIPRALPPRRDGAGRCQLPPSRGSTGAQPGFCAELGCHRPQRKAATGETSARAALSWDEPEQTVPEMVLGRTGVLSETQKTHSSTENFPFLPFLSFFPFSPSLSLPPAPAEGLQEPEGACSSLGLTPGPEESPAELPGSVAPLGSPPASELSEGTSDAASVGSSAAQAAEAQAAESGSSVSSAPESEKEGKKSKQHLYCPTCKVTVNSLSQLEAHNTGAKHKSMLEGHSTQVRRGRGKLLSRAGHKAKRIGNKGSINIQNKAFHCQVCEIYVNSETQLKQVTMPGLGAQGACRPPCTAAGGWGGSLMGVPPWTQAVWCRGAALAALAPGDPAVFLSQHMSSRRHKDRLAGKPPKPKYSPYNKLQKNAALAVSILKVSVSLQITHLVCSPKLRLPS
uniref:Zinc finger protein 385C n=1 Tax=Strix occidentalis caurina TaxID=311401 RepID=A0A8D0EWT5_STROC